MINIVEITFDGTMSFQKMHTSSLEKAKKLYHHNSFDYSFYATDYNMTNIYNYPIFWISFNPTFYSVIDKCFINVKSFYNTYISEFKRLVSEFFINKFNTETTKFYYNSYTEIIKIIHRPFHPFTVSESNRLKELLINFINDDEDDISKYKELIDITYHNEGINEGTNTIEIKFSIAIPNIMIVDNKFLYVLSNRVDRMENDINYQYTSPVLYYIVPKTDLDLIGLISTSRIGMDILKYTPEDIDYNNINDILKFIIELKFKYIDNEAARLINLVEYK